MSWMSSKDDLLRLLRSEGYPEDVVAAFSRVPRELFVPPDYRHLAYEDTALPTKNNQTISQPSVIAEMLRLAELHRGLRVLEIGTGTGYTAALTYEITRAPVVTVEYDPELCAEARERLRALGYTEVKVVCGDGGKGYPPGAPYDRVIIHAAVPKIPEPLVEQTREGGIIVAPVGSLHTQFLEKYVKMGDHLVLAERSMPVVFVPLRGEYGF
ncbi:MAG: protein-L-isoaspartate(D-aspartate) O-methyltransferase [Candidatus Diapherotrites archaeon]|nr:protein-L-isoaspartate(D-aspartate) O-methyltransferase [Candidatus Diapherotrites archaeon]MDN5366744.1 protein-L-isoaspartate(D-aspartate) O-methyltransferase [Candidatus Diapherotrites archaeon]